MYLSTQFYMTSRICVNILHLHLQNMTWYQIALLNYTFTQYILLCLMSYTYMNIVEIFILLNTMHKLIHLYIYIYTYLNKCIYTYALHVSYIIYACTTLLNITKDK
jgi:hypothetical protein